ncbi:MAG: lytic murein transglycosylase [Desulfobacterales bacterium]|nr:lytic murein transglycosylase [Desulfobacterales bacterium]
MLIMFHIRYIQTQVIIFLAMLAFIISSLVPPLMAMVKNHDEYFKPLLKRLTDDGFDLKFIENTYDKIDVELDFRGISLFCIHRESKLDYNQFLLSKPIKRAKEYLKKHSAELLKAEKEYDVDKTIITAIILVETQLGNYTGRSSILNILSTMSLLSYPKARGFIWQNISKTSDLTKEEFDKWADRKSIWAYEELKAYLKYAKENKFDPNRIKGSYAGAMGIPQFMPTNIFLYAKDGNNDGRINLFDHADAIISVASFLKHYGWHKQINKENAYKVLYEYNHSEYYANTILKISELLKK